MGGGAMSEPVAPRRTFTVMHATPTPDRERIARLELELRSVRFELQRVNARLNEINYFVDKGRAAESPATPREDKSPRGR